MKNGEKNNLARLERKSESKEEGRKAEILLALPRPVGSL